MRVPSSIMMLNIAGITTYKLTKHPGISEVLCCQLHTFNQYPQNSIGFFSLFNSDMKLFR